MLVMAGLPKIVMNRIIGISDLLTPIEGGAVIRRECDAMPDPRRQVRIGDKMPPEGDGIGMSRGDRGLSRGAVKSAGRDQHAAPVRAAA